jgi:glycogen synthase
MALSAAVEHPLRILAVGNMYPPHHAGGYEVMWQATMARARDLGHEVRVLTSDFRALGAGAETDPDVHRTLRWYWDLDRYEFPQLSPIDRLRLERRNARELERHLDEFPPHVVSWWSMGAMSLSLIERVRRKGLPAVFIVHDDWLVYGPGFDQWLRMWRGGRLPLAPVAERLAGLPTRVDFERAGSFVFNSRYTRDAAAGAGLGGARTQVVYPGIEASLRHELPRPPWGWRLVYLGRIDRQKGIDTAVEALAELPPQATLEVWGTGNEDYTAQIRSLAAQLGLRDRVSFRGWAGPAERLGAYERADVVVFPVRWEEPFGLVPIEAMGVGRSVVSTARGGSAEFLRDGENALVFESGDAAGLAAAITRLASDPELRQRLLEGGRRTAAEHTIERFADQTVQAILDAAHRGRP